MALEMKYFVLNPIKDSPHGRASRVALRAYAEVIAEEDEDLSEDLIDWVTSIEDGIIEAAEGELAAKHEQVRTAYAQQVDPDPEADG